MQEEMKLENYLIVTPTVAAKERNVKSEERIN
jgi:hypothetical protein